MTVTDAENKTIILEIQLKSRWNEIIVAELILLSCVFVVALLGNGIIFIAFCKSAKLQTTQNLYIMSFAVGDILMTVFVVPLSMVVVVKGNWVFSEPVCQFQGYIIAILVTVTILTITLTAVDRCFAMVYPDKYANFMTQYAVTGIIALGWFLATLVPSSYFLDGQKFSFHPGYLFCKPNIGDINYLFASTIAIIYLLVPLVSVVTSYLEVKRRIEFHRRELKKKEQNLSSKSELGKWNKDEEAARLFCATTLAILCLWVPTLLVEVIETFRGPYVMPRSLYVVCSLLGFAAFAVKIFVYSKFNKELKDEFCQIVKFRRSRRVADLSENKAETSSSHFAEKIKMAATSDSDKQSDTEEEEDEDELQFDDRTPTPYEYEGVSLAKRPKSRVDSGHYSEARTLPSTPFETRPNSVLSLPRREKIRKENVRFCENEVVSYPLTQTGPIARQIRKSNLPQRESTPPQTGSLVPETRKSEPLERESTPPQTWPEIRKPGNLSRQGEGTFSQTKFIVSQTRISTPAERNSTPPQILQTRKTTPSQDKCPTPQTDVAFSLTKPKGPQVRSADQRLSNPAEPNNGTTSSQRVFLPPLLEPLTIKTVQKLQDIDNKDSKNKTTDSPATVSNVGRLLTPIPPKMV